MTKKERDGLKKAIAYFVDEHQGGWEKGMSRLRALLRADAKRRQRLVGQKLQADKKESRTIALFQVMPGGLV
jgi:hypothetical protein